jgi:hypothetical protein
MVLIKKKKKREKKWQNLHHPLLYSLHYFSDTKEKLSCQFSLLG